MVERDLDWLRSQFGQLTTWRQHCETLKRLPHSQYPFGSGVFCWLNLVLPGFPEKFAVTLKEGNTDLWRPPDWLKCNIGLNRLRIKLEGQAPSGSFKDRGMPIPISDAIRLQSLHPELGIKYVACASTGDTSASASYYSAYVRNLLRCIVMVAEGKIQPAQMFQAEDAGAIVLAVKADGFDTAMKIAQQFCTNHPEIVLVNSKNALRIVGQETISLEIFADLGYKVPQWLAIPVGNAGNITAQMSAWLLLKELKFIDHLPGIICAQSEAASTVSRWIKSGFENYQPGQPASTIASAMNIQDPVSFPRVRFLRPQFQMIGYDVSEEEIATTRAQFNQAGAGLCPQGAVTVAAVLKARADGMVKEDDQVVAISTANNLKFTESGMAHHQSAPVERFANRPLVVDANLEAIEKALAEII